ncbi:unnamed protein product [Thelazia callipaeda]|uniref:RNA helicase n=1 Tax=Thelazia callipaeda TaxID=103827 RepID=A0A0N5D6Z4_THECL|nr:unnamed protein product [Thelazia callipaeda]
MVIEGEGRGNYIVESNKYPSKERRPEAGCYLDHLLNESLEISGPGEFTSIVSSFEDMNLHPKLMENILNRNYSKPLPIQKATFSLVQSGYDVIGHANTGSGKTAAFLIPVINIISKIKSCCCGVYERNVHPYCIIIAPTKELAEQLYEDVESFSAGLNCVTMLSFGEIPRNINIAQIRSGCDVFISTVGRLCDYVTNDIVKLHHLRFLVFDEADKLLQADSFYHDLMEYFLPRCREKPRVQKLLFSATDSNDLTKLKEIIMMEKATKVIVGSLNRVNPMIEQRIIKVEIHEKRDALINLMEKMYGDGCEYPLPKTIIYVNTKRFATVIACYLSLKGYKAYPVQGNLTTTLRRQAIEALQNGECYIIVSTDVTARGLDIKDISHVINYEMPRPENLMSYIHRVGRTGRAGNIGCATTFYTPCTDRSLALILYRWLEMNNQEVPDFLVQEAKLQANLEDLQSKAKEEYERVLNENVGNSYMENSDEEGWA